MVGLLIAFCINNAIWAIFVIYLISITQNKSLPRILPHKKVEEIEEYPEATDDQINAELNKFKEKVKEETGFDENGVQVEAKEEKVVE